VIVGVAAGIDVSDGAELLVGTQVKGERGLLCARGEVAGAILRKIGFGGSGIDESRGKGARRDDGDRLTFGATSAVRLATIVDVLLHEDERRQNRVRIDLIQIVRAL